jgi:hypothetical protein
VKADQEDRFVFLPPEDLAVTARLESLEVTNAAEQSVDDMGPRPVNDTQVSQFSRYIV